MKVRALTLSAVAAAATLVPFAGPAQAADCGVTVPNIWVDRPIESLLATKMGGCTSATWDVVHVDWGYHGTFAFSGAGTQYDRLSFRDGDPYGRYRVLPTGAQTSTVDASQNATSFAMRSGSSIVLSAVRDGAYVNFSSLVRNYRPAYNEFRPWGGARVVLQTRSAADQPWQYVRAVWSNSEGRSAWHVYSPDPDRQYRVYSTGTSQVWGNSTAPVTR
jgi:hypothetical protein